MQIIAVQKYVRTPARKVRLVANAVKSMSVLAAMQQLAVMDRAASDIVTKVMRQAIANAVHNHSLSPADLEIESIQINGGPTYKRFRAVSRGRAHNIFKRTSHVIVVLKTKSIPAEAATEKVAITAPTEVKAETTAEVAPISEKTKAAPKKATSAKKADKKTETTKSIKKTSTVKSK